MNIHLRKFSHLISGNLSKTGIPNFIFLSIQDIGIMANILFCKKKRNNILIFDLRQDLVKKRQICIPFYL